MKILFYGFRHGHINALYNKVKNSPDWEIYACIEEDEDAKLNAQKNLGAVFTDKSYDEILLEDFDAVAIGTYYGGRGKAIIKALSNGKHVICDKPVCTDLKELYQITKLSNDKGLKISCMLDLRYLPQSIKALEIINSKKLGSVRNISFNGQHCIDYPNRPKWYFEKGKHGGTVNDLAIHGIDLTRMLTGEEFINVDAVKNWNAYATKHPDFLDCAVFMATLESGAVVTADVSYSAPSQVFSMPTYWEFKIWCDKGLITFNYKDATLTVYEDGKDTALLTLEDNGNDYLTEFTGCIKNNDESVTLSLLKSTETALKIQKIANKRK